MADIKISDLSIGDWVRHTFYEENLQIKRIDGERERLLVEKGLMSVSCHLDHFEPIPLTPEILEKNGLCVVEEDADFCEYELFGSENFSIFHTKGTVHYRLETPQASVVCWNVHQLQHALRLAGVEKEVEI